MKTKTLIAIILLTAILTSTATATVLHYSMQRSDEMHLFVDDETGVEYWVYWSRYQGAMSVRYNKDGTIKIAEGY